MYQARRGIVVIETPSGAAGHRRHFERKRAALSSWIYWLRSKCCEFGERSKWREAQGIPHSMRGKPSGPHFFWASLRSGLVNSGAAQRKVPCPGRAKPARKSEITVDKIPSPQPSPRGRGRKNIAPARCSCKNNRGRGPLLQNSHHFQLVITITKSALIRAGFPPSRE